jgi:hypothetical protein
MDSYRPLLEYLYDVDSFGFNVKANFPNDRPNTLTDELKEMDVGNIYLEFSAFVITLDKLYELYHQWMLEKRMENISVTWVTPTGESNSSVVIYVKTKDIIIHNKSGSGLDITRIRECTADTSSILSIYNR